MRRQSPGLLERTSISDAEGYPVNIDHRPSEIEHGGWDVDTSPATDEEGWQYASIFRCRPLAADPKCNSLDFSALHKHTSLTRQQLQQSETYLCYA